MSRNKLVCLAVVVCAILLFLSERGVILHPIYTIYACLLAIYFWPVAFILDVVKNKQTKALVYSFISNLVFSNLLVFSALAMIVPDVVFVSNVFLTLRLANGLLFVFHFFFTDDMDRAFYHALFGIIQ